MDVFAVFVVAVDEKGSFAFTTRPESKTSKFGLPGGKVDAGESLSDAVIREATEEGWLVTLRSNDPFYTDIVKGRKIAWFAGDVVEKLVDYKEAYRGIKTLLGNAEWACKTGYKNDLAIDRFLEIYAKGV